MSLLTKCAWSPHPCSHLHAALRLHSRTLYRQCRSCFVESDPPQVANMPAWEKERPHLWHFSPPHLKRTIPQKSPKLQKAGTVDFKKTPRTEGGCKVHPCSVEPSLAAGLPFPVPDSWGKKKPISIKNFGEGHPLVFPSVPGTRPICPVICPVCPGDILSL